MQKNQVQPPGPFHHHGPRSIHPSAPALRAWLQAPGSLTARLQRFGTVQVLVQQQRAMTLWPLEQADLQQRLGYVREVVLLLDGRAAVWARSCTPLAASHGPWSALRGLGTRPLAELLFASRQVLRSPLQAQALPRHGAQLAHIARQWRALPGALAPSDVPRWARSSVFWHGPHPLRVMEAFSPWVASLA